MRAPTLVINDLLNATQGINLDSDTVLVDALNSLYCSLGKSTKQKQHKYPE